MAKKLKELEITKVDFVDRGANPKADIKVAKKDNCEIEGIIKSFINSFKSAFNFDCKENQVGFVKNTGKSLNNTGGIKEMKFNIENMAPEDKALFDRLTETYGVEDTNKGCGDSKKDERVGKEETTEKETKATKKSFDDSEIDTLRKRVEYFENKELNEIAKKYEPLGKKHEEIVETLKKYKGDDDAYNTIISAWDLALDNINKSDLFEEIGKSGTACGSCHPKVENMAKEIMKSDTSLNRFQAIDKVYQMHPELISEED